MGSPLAGGRHLRGSGAGGCIELGRVDGSGGPGRRRVMPEQASAVPHHKAVDVSLERGQDVAGIEHLSGCRSAGSAVSPVQESGRALDNDRSGHGIDVTAGGTEARMSWATSYDDVHDELSGRTASRGRGVG